jgi:hypothetical protein
MSMEQATNGAPTPPVQRSIHLAFAAVLTWLAFCIASVFWPSMFGFPVATKSELALDVGISLLLSYGLVRGSRVCALLLFATIGGSSVGTAIQSSHPLANFLALGVSTLLWLGVVGTFRLHRRTSPRTLRQRILLGVAVAGGTLLALAFGFAAYVGVNAPPMQVLQGGQIPKHYVDALHELGAIESDEKVRFFYSSGFMDFRDGMYALTDRRLVLANREWSEPLILIPLAEVKDFDVHFGQDWAEDSLLTVVRSDGEIFSVPLATTARGDRHFAEALRTAILPEGSRHGTFLVQ